MTVYPEPTDNDALRGISKSSKRLESLTLVLIFLTVLLAILEFPRFIVEVNTSLSMITELVIFGFLIVILAYIIWFRDEIYKVLGKIPQYVSSKSRLKHEKRTVERRHGGRATLVIGENVQWPTEHVTLEDFSAAIVLLIISIVFLWLSYKLEVLFPSQISNAMIYFVLFMWIMFVSSIIIIAFLVYRWFKGSEIFV